MIYMVYDGQMLLRCVVEDWDQARHVIETLVAANDLPTLHVYHDSDFKIEKEP